jgi:hypothetical protein
MRVTRPGHLSSRLLPLLAFPTRAGAQTAGVDSARTTQSPSVSGGSVAVVAMMLVMVLAIGVAVKLFGRRRKHGDEALSLQSQISDALLQDPSLVGLPITGFAGGSGLAPFTFSCRDHGNRTLARVAGCRHAAGRPGVVPSSARRAGRGSARGRSADVEADGTKSMVPPVVTMGSVPLASV